MLELLFAGPWGPLVIFGLRIVDVSLSTVRMLLSIRNIRRWVPVIGFVEVTIWVVAVGTAIQHLDSVWHIVGYSGGFAAGTLVGLWIEGRLAMGLATIRIICRHGEWGPVAEGLRARGFGVTEIAATGREGPVGVLLSIVHRRQIQQVLTEVERLDEDAFVTVEEPRSIVRGWTFPARRK